MKSMLFLINPVSGKKALEDCLMQVIEVFTKADYDITVCLTKSEEHMKAQVIERGGDYDVIVCCGGDGTLNLVAGAVFKNEVDTIVGYIPGGTTNDFANTRNIDTYCVGAAQQICDGPVRNMDMGLLNGNPFIYVAAFGMFSEISYLTSRELKQNMGYAAYVMGGFKSLATTKPYRLNIEFEGEDGVNTIDGDFILGMISNSRRVGGIEMPIMKNVEFDDGEMEITLVRHPKNPIETQKVLNCLVMQIADESMVYMFKTSRVKITCEDEVPWALDGEFGGSYKESEVLVKGGAIKMKF